MRRDLWLLPQIGSVPKAHFLFNKMKHFIEEQYQALFSLCYALYEHYNEYTGAIQ